MSSTPARRHTIAILAVMVPVTCQAVRPTPSHADAPALVAQAPVTVQGGSAAYRVEWEQSHVPPEAAAKVRISVPVTLRNIGNRVWPSSTVFVAYHWFRNGRLVTWDGERTGLPRDLEPGGRVAMAVRVTTPGEPGAYVLQITLVEELVTWFENKGADTVIRPIDVRPPTESAGADEER